MGSLDGGAGYVTGLPAADASGHACDISSRDVHGATSPAAAAARVGIRPRSGPAGTVVMLNAYGFLVGERVEVQAVTDTGRTFASCSRTANDDGDVRGFPIEIDQAICCPGSMIQVGTTGRLSRLTAEITFSII